MNLKDWENLYESQGGKCVICDRNFDEKIRPCIDHLHVKGYKKLSFEKRKKWVRGLLCLYCNRRLVPKGMTANRAYNIYKYLKEFDEKSESYG